MAKAIDNLGDIIIQALASNADMSISATLKPASSRAFRGAAASGLDQPLPGLVQAPGRDAGRVADRQSGAIARGRSHGTRLNLIDM
jgi:hypothetical protein